MAETKQTKGITMMQVTPAYRAILFDLDGTLTNSGPGIMDSVRKTLAGMDKPALSESGLRKFIGPPLSTSFRTFCGMNEEETADAIRRYRLIYRGGNIFNASVYPGIPKLLTALRRAGAFLAVATSKPASMTKDVLNHFGLMPYFDFVSAADESERSRTKDTIILPAVKAAECSPAQAIMIGDTCFDAQGARLAGTSFIGVLYGFGSEAEMRKEGAEKFVRLPAELRPMLIDNG
jgi:phosphoglycolate phosphatase